MEYRIQTMDMGSGKPLANVVIPTRSVDSAQTQDCLRNLESLKIPLHIYFVVASGPEWSFSRAENTAIRAAISDGADLIFGMDDDSYPEPGAFEKVLAFSEKYPHIGQIGTTTYGPGYGESVGMVFHTLPSFIYHHIKAKAPLFAARRLMKGRWDNLAIHGTSTLLPGKMLGQGTSFYAIRAKCFEDVGPMDENFRASLADVDYCMRLQLSKWSLSTVVGARVKHIGQVSRSWSDEFKYWSYFLNKWSPEDVGRVRKRIANNENFFFPPANS